MILFPLINYFTQIRRECLGDAGYSFGIQEHLAKARCFLCGEEMIEKEVKAFYNSAAWKHKRMKILERDHYECQDCRKRLEKAAGNGIKLEGRDRKIWPAEEVHHIKELREYPELALADDNLISLCARCHNLRHGREPHKFIKRKKRLTEEKW